MLQTASCQSTRVMICINIFGILEIDVMPDLYCYIEMSCSGPYFQARFMTASRQFVLHLFTEE